MPHFFYLCYSLKPTARGEWLGYISKGWSGFSQGIDPKPKAVWSCTFSGHRSGPLREPRDRWEKAAGGCLAGTSFRGTFPKAGGAFRRGLTKSRRQSGAALFRVIAAGRWRDFSKRIDQKPKAVWSQRFFGAHFRRLERLFAEYRPKAEGYLKLLFFESSQRAVGVFFYRGLTQS